jgi:hypothetical protein
MNEALGQSDHVSINQLVYVYSLYLAVIQWSEIDEIPNDLDIQSPSHVSNSQSAPSSSNSSAIVAALCPPETTPSVNDLLSIDSPWGNNSVVRVFQLATIYVFCLEIANRLGIGRNVKPSSCVSK